MPKIRYKTIRLQEKTKKVIAQANAIIIEYQQIGHTLTVRQLYYQFVARNLFPEDRRWEWTKGRWVRSPDGTKNAPPNYDWLSCTVNNGRLTGLIDWEAIIDRTRTLKKNNHFDTPQDILNAAASQYKINTRADQKYYLEVWIEKDALIGAIEKTCGKLDVPHFSCRGYVSQSAMWMAAKRILREEMKGKQAIIIHLGDHDPSGINMTEDIGNRLEMFGTDARVDRIALNMNQIQKHLPHDPAKLLDPRSKDYISKYGDLSWELDALDPQTLSNLVEKAISKYTDTSLRNMHIYHQEEDRAKLKQVSANWEKLTKKKNK